MSFLKSAINQVGRDMGKVVSNQIFQDNHSSPYRSVGQHTVRLNNSTKQSNLKSDFDKAINFQMGHRPITLIAKISGVYTVIKNEANYYVSDGYLDTKESESLFEMLNRLNMKIDDICDVLELDSKGNEKEINQLTILVEKTNILFKNTLEISAKGCFQRQKEHEIEALQIKKPELLSFIGYHLIWMGKYARGSKKSITNTILANIADVITCTFPLTRTYLFLKGLFTFSGEKKRIITIKNAHMRLAELEGKRAETYLNMA
ncbi:hypothetical protein NO995_09370 [Aestuariibaculum sp. M13]|uniref:hypothetical protein n=1 Tax=Aestuariibaculum sp. M13 TaxID=2967132 RepID=UPI00215A03D3|nr:hypothetical protein [Aestuariibaculum sp. M13]MCR8667890.1 hypothetical protein [Aestuariibaculum sp. M13]